MAANSKSVLGKQQWLYFGENRLVLFETVWPKNALPQLCIKATLNTQQPLQNPSTHASWVAQHASGKINFLIATPLLQILLADVPDVPLADQDDAMHLKAGELINFELEDATLDFIYLPKEAYRGRMRMAYIIAMQKSLLVGWLQALIGFGIRVNTIDSELTQLRNLSVRHQNRNESGILHLSTKRSRLLLNYNNEMVLNRVFDIGLANLAADDTVLDGELELTVSEDDHSDIQLDALALEIQRSFDYYESQLALGAISEVQVLCHEEYEIISQKLANKLGTRFQFLRPQDFVDIQPAEQDDNPVSYYGLVGTLYREELA